MFDAFATFSRLNTPAPRSKQPVKRKRSGKRRAAGGQRLEPRLPLTGPTAENASYYLARQGSLDIPAYAGLASYESGGNGPLSTVLVQGPSFGSLTLNSGGSFDYRNTNPMASGDSFTFEAYDGSSYSNTATVSLSFQAYQPQVSQNIQINTVHDRTYTMSAPGVLAGASDPNHLNLTASLVTPPSHGSLTLNSDGSLTYTPNTHYTGSDSFSFQGYDGNYSGGATASINVTNRVPVANNDGYDLPNDQPFTTTAATGVLANDTDPDGDTLSASLVTGPSHGTLSLNSNGSFSYTPNAHWVGSDTFVYAASDGIASCRPCRNDYALAA